jgi:thiosulfate reductase cytochrome b subunit
MHSNHVVRLSKSVIFVGILSRSTDTDRNRRSIRACRGIALTTDSCLLRKLGVCSICATVRASSSSMIHSLHGDDMPPNPDNVSQTVEPQVQLAAKHTLLTRTLHWLNMVAICALVGTGITMLIGGKAVEAFAGSIHEVFYFLLLGVGAVYVISLVASGGWRMFLPTPNAIADATAVVKSELRLGTHTPRLKKYNGAQRLAYGAVLLMAAGEVATGLAMAYRTQLPWLGTLLGGRRMVHTIHMGLMFGIIAFVLVHVVQVVRAGWPSIRSMLSGYDMVPAGSSIPIDGAFPDHLGVPIAQSACQAEIAARTRRGFVGAAAAAALGAVLVVVGGVRGSDAHRARAASSDGAAQTRTASRADADGDDHDGERHDRRDGGRADARDGDRDDD